MSAGEIATALSKSSVSARLAGMSMDELIASVSVIGEVTQNSMDSVGVAMKSLLARYGNVKAGVFSSMGLDDDGETTENINDIEKVLGKLGIRVRSSNLEMRSLSDVLDELNEKWSTYDTVTKNAIATAFGGTRQRENFLVLMENYDRYKELTEESANAAGTADKKYEAYMDSMEAATKRLTNAWEEFTLKLKSSTIMKAGVNLLALFVENMDKLLTTTRILIPLIFSNKIKNFFSNTAVKAGELGGRVKTHFGFTSAKTTFTRDENGNLVASLDGGEQGVMKAGFNQLHQDLEKLINVTKGEIQKEEMSNGNIAGIKRGWFGLKSIQLENGESVDFKAAYRGGQRHSELDDIKLTNEQVAALAGDKSKLVTFKTSQYDQLVNAGFAKKGEGPFPNIEFDKKKMRDELEFRKLGVGPEYLEAIRRANKQIWKTSLGTGAVMGALAGLTVGFGSKSYAGGSSWGAQLAKVTGVKSGDQQVESKGGSIAKSVAAGIGAGVSMLPPPWNLVGAAISTLAPIAIDFFDTWTHRDELERKERSEQAQKQLDALNGIQSTIENSTGVMSKDIWVSDDYKAFKEYVNNLNQSYLDMEGDFSGATDTFIANFNKAAEKLEISTIKIENINDLYDQLADANIEVRKKAQRAIELANLQAQREQYIKSQEDNLYNWSKTVGLGNTNISEIFGYQSLGQNFLSLFKNVATDKEGNFSWETLLKSISSGSITTWVQTVGESGEVSTIIDELQEFKNLSPDEIVNKIQELQTRIKEGEAGFDFLDNDAVIAALDEQVSAIKKAQAEMDAYKKKVAEMDTEIGILSADIWDLSDSQLTALTMDGVVGKVVAAMELQGVEVRDAAGYIKDEYLSAIKAAIKSNSQFSALLKGDARTIAQINRDMTRAQNVFGGKWDYRLLKGMLDRGESIKGYAENGQGYSEEELAAIVYGASPDTMRNFANAWNTTEKSVKELTDRFGDLTTAEGLMSSTEIVDKYSSLSTIFEDLAGNSALTAENFNKMIELYPQLISGAGNLTDLYDKIVNQQAISQANAALTAIKTNTAVGAELQKEFIDAATGGLSAEFIDGLKIDDIKDELSKALGKNGLTIENVLMLAETYSRSDNENYKEVAERLKNTVYSYFDNLPDIEINNPALEKAVEYQEKLWKKQISNLEEQKEALSKVNDEREKELNLMKAQEQLENARKEKKMVYREGVGFVYEADESAISEAQKNLENLDTQKRQDEIQAEIDRLNYLQETLDALKDDQELARLKENFDRYATAQEKNGEIIESNTAGVLQLAEALNNQKIGFNAKKDDKGNYTGDIDITQGGNTVGTLNPSASKSEQVDYDLTEFEDAYKALKTGADEFNRENHAQGSAGYSKEVAEYNDLVRKYNEAKEKLGGAADKDSDYQQMDAIGRVLANEKSDANFRSYDGNLTNPSGKLMGNHVASISVSNVKLYNNGDVIDDSKLNDQFGKTKFTAIKRYDTEKRSWGDWKKEGLEVSDLKKLPNYSIVMNSDYYDKYAYVYDGQLRKLSADSTPNEFKYAKGTLSKPSSDLSYINELGTEVIITPSGTLTALPSKTGIIPADITKNLWGLGKVAPNLVGMLDSLKQQRFDTEAKTITNEEGVYIDRLDMSIYPKEGYNMDEFISQLRAKAALTRQNN